jgi:mitosis inhibitor protein kinase SWE1
VITAEWQASPSRLSTQFSPAKNTIKFMTQRSVSGSSSSSAAILNSPSARRQLPISGTVSAQQTQAHKRPNISPVQRLPEPERPQSGRFERDFVEDDEVGSGEFGKVMKVRYKSGREGEVFAVKKSKRFEGVRHRWVS